MDLRDPETWLFIGGSALLGAIVGAVVARAGSPPAASAPVPAPTPTESSSGGLQLASSQSLTPGWTYYLSAWGTGAADVASLSKQLQSLGFSEAGKAGTAPKMTPHGSQAATALATFNGSVGTTMPAPTTALTWDAAGIPTPEVLSA